jgi:competence protein ComGC
MRKYSREQTWSSGFTLVELLVVMLLRHEILRVEVDRRATGGSP